MTKTSGILICALAVCGCGKTQPPAPPATPTQAIAATAAQTDGTGVASLEVTVMPKEYPPDSPLKPEYLTAMQLSTPMAEALAKYAPGFVSWKIEDYPPKQVAHYPYAANSLPYAVKGDFNGDGIIDIALTGHTQDDDIFAVFMSSSPAEYYPVTIERSNIFKRLRDAGKDVDYKPLRLLLFKQKGLTFSMSESNDSELILPFDGFLAKEIQDIYHLSTHLEFRNMSDASPSVYSWQISKKEFQTATRFCEASNLSLAENEHCF